MTEGARNRLIARAEGLCLWLTVVLVGLGFPLVLMYHLFPLNLFRAFLVAGLLWIMYDCGKTVRVLPWKTRAWKQW